MIEWVSIYGILTKGVQVSYTPYVEIIYSKQRCQEGAVGEDITEGIIEEGGFDHG